MKAISLFAVLFIPILFAENLNAIVVRENTSVQLLCSGNRKNIRIDRDGKISAFVHIRDVQTPEILIQVRNAEKISSSIDGITRGSPQISVGKPVIIRGVRLAVLTIKPYFVKDGGVYLAKEIEISGTGLANNRVNLSVPWDNLFTKLVLNYRSTEEYIQPHLLIISDDDFIPYLDEFISWKKQRGIRVTLISLSEIAPSPGSESIRNFVQNAYDSWAYPPDYLLLVGDENHIPVYWLYATDPVTIFSSESVPGWYTSDEYYGCVDGEDSFPDILVGRISSSNVLETRTILNKVLFYERSPQTETPDFYSRAIVASDYLYPSQRFTKLQTREIMLSHEYTHVDTLFTYGHVNSMMQWINQGRSIINYRGAGWSEGWVMIDFYSYNVHNLQNFNLLPVVFGIGCGVGIITDTSPGFGEVWMTEGTPALPKGSVGFVGPSWNTHTDFNNQLDLGIFRSVFEDSLYTLGDLLLAGKMRMWSYFEGYIPQDPNIETILNQEVLEFRILSDPTLALRTVIPSPVHLSISPNVVQLGDNTITLSVVDEDSLPVEGAVCGVMSSEDSVWSGVTDANGQLSLDISVAEMPAYLKSAVFRHDLYPDTLTVQVVSNAQFLRLDGLEIDEVVGDTNHALNPGEEVELYITVKNWGLSPAGGVTALLSSADDLSEILIDSCFIGYVNIMQSTSATNPFIFYVDSTLHNGDQVGFNLDLYDSTGNHWGMFFSLPVTTPEFEITGVTPVDSSNGLYRGDRVNVGIFVRNRGGAASDTILAKLETNADSLIIIQDSGMAAPLESGEQGLAQTFILEIPKTAWDTEEFPASLFVSAKQATYTIEQEIAFSIPVDKHSSDPGYDTGHTYYCFDKYDSDFVQQSQFQWTEISPLAGGPGTAIPYPGTELTAPFQINYYDIPVQQITICHKGYISLGNLDVLLTDNVPLPNPGDGISGMLAPFWLNLGHWSVTDYDVSYFHDPVRGVLIIEWYNIPVYEETSSRCTFQVLIYDEGKHPTINGYPEIEFRYLKFTGLLNPNFYGTIGIESIDELYGITYKSNSQLFPGSGGLTDSSAILFTPDIALKTGTDIQEGGNGVPKSFTLGNPYPNPFNSDMSVNFYTPEYGEISFEILDINGRLIYKEKKRFARGIHQWKWTGVNTERRKVSSGVYFLNVIYGTDIFMKKAVHIK